MFWLCWSLAVCALSVVFADILWDVDLWKSEALQGREKSHFSAEYHTFIWALKGPNLSKIYIAVLSKYENILLEKLSFKVGLNICVGAEALAQFTTVKLQSRRFVPNYLRLKKKKSFMYR